MRLAVQEALDGGQVVWCAPTFKQVAIGWREAIKACQRLIDAKLIIFNKSEGIAYFPNGGHIYFISLDDPDNARGFTATLVIIDEAGDCPEIAWYDVLRPMLMDTGGGAWIIGTPRGRNWFFKEHQLAWLAWLEYFAGRRTTMPEGKSWAVPTVGHRIVIDPQTGIPSLVRIPHAYENPHIQFSELESMFETMTETGYRQEIGAQFIDNTSSVFVGFDKTVLRGVRHNTPWIYGHRYQLGVDVAEINDYTVISVMDLTESRQVYFQRFHGRGWQRVYNDVEQVAKSYKAPVVFDATGVGDVPAEELRRRGVHMIPIKFSHALKRDVIQHCAALIEHQRVRWMDIAQQTFEFQAYQYSKTQGGKTTTNAPKGENSHDDTVTAGALSVWGHRPQLKDGVSSGMIAVVGDPSGFTNMSFHLRESWGDAASVFAAA